MTDAIASSKKTNTSFTEDISPHPRDNTDPIDSKSTTSGSDLPDPKVDGNPEVLHSVYELTAVQSGIPQFMSLHISVILHPFSKWILKTPGRLTRHYSKVSQKYTSLIQAYSTTWYGMARNNMYYKISRSKNLRVQVNP